MAQTLTESVKIVKNALEANGVYPDAVSKNKDGHIVVRDTFFYKAGRTSEGHTHKVKKALDAAGIKHSIVDDGEHWAPFRGGASVAKSSHFYTNVKLHENAEINEGHFKNSESIIFGNKLASRQFHTELKRKHPELETAITDIGGGRHKVSVMDLRSSNAFGSAKALSRKHAAIASSLNEESVDEARLVSMKTFNAQLAKNKAAESRRHDRHYDEQPEHVKNNLNTHLRNGMTYPDAVAKEVGKHKGATPLNEENDLRTQIFKPSFAGNAVSDHNKHLSAIHKKLGRGEIEQINSLHHTFDNPYGKTTVLTTPHGTHITHVIHTNEETVDEAYPSAAAMSRKAKAEKQARAVARGYENQRSGKWSSQSYKTEDGRWASKDVKEETLVERYKRATGRATLREASAGTLVSTKGSDKASRYEMHTNMPGEASEYSSIIKTHQDGKPLQNRWGGYNTLRTGKTAYVKKHFDKLDEEVLGEGPQIRSDAFAFTHTPGDTDSEEKLTKLKKMVKAHNSAVDEHSKLRITARGRLGKDNPNADKYRKGGEVWNAKSRPAGTYDADHNWTPKADGSRKRGEMRDLPMKDAKHHDIYVQAAPRGWDKPGFQERYAKDPYNKISTNHAKSLIAAHKSICEEAEQIDELSKTTLGSYVKKASNDVASKAVEYGTKKAERDEVDRITNRHMKYADKDTVHQALKTTSDDVEAPRVKAAKRIGGITKAVNRLTNEDVQLDEAPYYSLEASKARMAKEKARATAKAAIAAAKVDSAIARKEARENRSLHIARHIEAEVGNHYPDSDGFEAISNKVRKLGIPHHEVIDHLDKAARKHLGAKSFDHYVDNFHKDAQGSN